MSNLPPIPSLSLVAPSNRITLPPSLRHATNRVCIPNQRSGSNTQSGGRCWQISYVPINGVVRIGFWNGAILTGGAGESGNGGTMTLRCSITQSDGTTTATYSSAAVANNALGYVDIPGVVNPACKKFIINWDIGMGSGGFIPSMGYSNCADRGNGDQYQAGSGGYGHTQDSTYLGSGEASNWLPQYVSVMSDRKVWVLITDSLGETDDTVFDPAGGRGLFGRGAALVGPHLNWAAPGDRASVAAAGFTARAALLVAAGASSSSPFSAILQLGRNDITAGRSAAQIIPDRNTITTTLKANGVDRVYGTTITPYTTSSDLGNTTAGQAPQSAPQEIVRCTANDFWRGAGAYATTGTLTNGSANITAVASLTLLGLFPGQVMTSTTSGIAGGATISSINYSTSTIVMSGAFTGTTTPGAAITATSPSTGQTFPTNQDGLADICALLEGATTLAYTPVRNGGVWVPGMAALDMLHMTTNGYLTNRPLVDGLMAVL
jgi:hypothetical protein